MADKYQAIVINIIQTEGDSINWSKALQLNDFLNRSRTHDNEIFGMIHTLASNGDRHDKLNAIALIDSFFKNGNSNLLLALQNSRAILGISDYAVISDPYVHRVLCSAAEEWTNTCSKNRCCQQSFLEWQRKLFSFKYRYVMTPKMQAKFSADFSTAFELLSMFSQALIAAQRERTSPDDETLVEMVTNVIEVHRRLMELESTMNDKYVLSIMRYLEDYCEACKQCYSSFSKTRNFDHEFLSEIASRGIPKSGQQDSPQPPESSQSPQQQQPFTPQFPQTNQPSQPPFQPSQPPFQPPFQPPPQPAPQPAVVDDLLDLSFTGPPQPQQQQQPGPYQQQTINSVPQQPFNPFVQPQQQQPQQNKTANGGFEFADDLI